MYVYIHAHAHTDIFLYIYTFKNVWFYIKINRYVPMSVCVRA